MISPNTNKERVLRRIRESIENVNSDGTIGDTKIFKIGTETGYFTLSNLMAMCYIEMVIRYNEPRSPKKYIIIKRKNKYKDLMENNDVDFVIGFGEQGDITDAKSCFRDVIEYFGPELAPCPLQVYNHLKDEFAKDLDMSAARLLKNDAISIISGALNVEWGTYTTEIMAYDQAIPWCRDLLSKVMRKYDANERLYSEMELCYGYSKNTLPDTLISGYRYPLGRFKKVHPELKFVIYKIKDDLWRADVIHPDIKMPENWHKRKSEDLSETAKVKGLRFCDTKERFLTGTSKDACVNACANILFDYNR